MIRERSLDVHLAVRNGCSPSSAIDLGPQRPDAVSRSSAKDQHGGAAGDCSARRQQQGLGCLGDVGRWREHAIVLAICAA